jgi:hypothetical protein
MGAAAGLRRSAAPEQHGTVDHDPVAGLHAMRDRHEALGAGAGRDRPPLEPAGCALHEHHRPPVLEHHRVGGQDRQRSPGPRLPDAAEHLGAEAATRVRQVHRDLERAGLGIEHVADARDGAAEDLVGERDQADRDRLADVDEAEQRLGDVRGDPHRAQVRDDQERRGGVRAEGDGRPVLPRRHVDLENLAGDRCSDEGRLAERVRPEPE